MGIRGGSLLICALIGTAGCNDAMEEAASPIGPPILSPASAENACGSASPRAPFTGECYDPMLEAADFAGVAEDNPYFPLIPGSIWRYESESKDGAEIIIVEVTNDTKTITLPDGGGTIETTVVLDQVYECEELEDCELVRENLVEETFDWYAQDTDGNVWYFGEESFELEDGEVVSTEGSWEAYVDGALPGIIMLADPEIGHTYRQEFYAGEAEDLARVVSLNRAVSVPYGDFDGCLKTQDWNPLENASQEQKFYCPGVGLVLEVGKQNVRVELVDVQ